MQCFEKRELVTDPLLITATIAGPDLHCRAIRGACPGHVEAEAGPATDDRAIGVEVPLLIAAAVAVPDFHPGARRRREVRHVEALIAIHLELAVGQVGPLLVAAAITVPDLQQRAV